MTCIKSHIDHVVAATPPLVSFASATASLSAPPLPPFGQPPGTVKAFGWGLTYDEARALAEDQNVERIGTSSGVQFEVKTPGCPPDLSTPIPMSVCPRETEPPDGKISPPTAEAFSMAGSSPVEVILAIAGGPTFCPLDTCTEQQCPSRDAIFQRWEDETKESQRCVRARIDELGGQSSPEVFVIGNAVLATLNGAQAEELARDPQVIHISLNGSSAPPP